MELGSGVGLAKARVGWGLALPPGVAQRLGTRFLPDEPIFLVLIVVSLGYSVGKSGVGGASGAGPASGSDADSDSDPKKRRSASRRRNWSRLR